MKVSIVIPAHNAAATIHACLSACTRQTYPDCHVIVVDDGSADATAEAARAFPVTVVQQPQRGPAAARNAGANAASTEVIAFTDSDCVPHADWIAQLIAPIAGQIAAVGGTYGIANPGSALARIIHAEILARHAGYGGRIDFAGSYNMAIRRDVFLELNGFDEDFRTSSAEDNDLCYRATATGREIAFARDAVVDHYHPDRLWKYLRTQARHGFWRMKLYAKHPQRKSGDRYASGPDLWAPLFAAAAGAALAFSAIAVSLPVFTAALLAIAILFALRLVTAARVARVYGPVPVVFAGTVFFLRDFARAMGLAAGVWRFLLLRRATA